MRASLELVALLAVLQVVAGQSFQQSTTTTTIRLRTRGRRPEACRESLLRRAEELPALVVVGRVREVYLAAGSEANSSTAGVVSAQGQQPHQNRALVNVGRVVKGNKQLLNTDIIVTNFNSSSAQPCPNYVKPNDTLILLLNHDGDRKYSVQAGNLLSMNLNNLERINAIASDEPYKRRNPIEDILCEAHYCPYGRCAIVDERNQRVACQCPDSCAPLPALVCGSDNATYANECHLIREGCRRQRPLFVTKEGSC